MLLAALALLATQGRPLLFRQERAGYQGRTFVVSKLRTLGETRRPTANDAAPPLYKLHDDPRAGRIGHLIRRHGIDELPQLWNVIRGEMKLVGPRPLIPAELEQLPPAVAAARGSCKPGITGAWQTTPRRHDSIKLLIDADAAYAARHNALTDLRILVRTIPTVLRGQV